ncbi:Histone-lysine N-methyltransferase SETMAR [Anthophora quadrimaculata]
MLRILWDVKGPIHYELLKPKERLNLEMYCQHMDELNEVLEEKMLIPPARRVILQHENAGSYTGKIAELCWQILSHRP